jgi:ubiquinone/menaquinone biosynthesis C-methylase UbiE
MLNSINRLLQQNYSHHPKGNISANDMTGTFINSELVGLYDATLSGWFINERNEIYQGITISAADIVLDVGCGEGGMLGFCASRGSHIIGIDCDMKALDLARERATNSKARVTEFYHAPAEHIPVTDGLVTRVICTEVLEHVEDPKIVLAELYRVGSLGALYLITVPDPLQEQMQQHVAPKCYFQHPNHIRIINRNEFVGLVENAGLEVISQSSYGFFWSIWWALFWGCETTLDNPVLTHWTQAWSALLETPKGRKIQEGLNHFLPKSQVIVAVKSV